ncbi:hypothetical protein HYPSUDRAFT_69376 [Hypholoma sublateritium FD-334 SS-4]|uniref:Transcription termination and cleavage factor C-terminal domain-containing protein n=1 Tax=Hypholoma sublateritium (strain FD-334 SS-4) TaxID=945553 RepID=A0A0D2PGK0_HYPSF|nr:hypothetical protein HYPSUDRAFT_69376 [Hypholoma sublateritium FD-334 SS-4]
MSNPHLATEQLLELLLTLKQTTPAAAKSILNNQPAIAYALITLMVSMNAVNIEVFQNTLAEYGAANPPDAAAASTPASRPISAPPTNPIGPPPAAPAPVSAIPPHLQAQYRTSTPPSFPGSSSLPPSSALASSSSQPPAHTPTPPYGYNITNGQGSVPAAYGGYQSGYGYQQQQQQPAYQQQGGYQQPPYQQQSGYPGYPPYQQAPPQVPAPPAAAATPTLPDTLAGISEEQKTLIMRVLAMTPEQINMLPPTDRATYIQIRTTLGVPT